MNTLGCVALFGSLLLAIGSKSLDLLCLKLCAKRVVRGVGAYVAAIS